ncbi:MAG: alkane 1-monooxygenase [Immundisolibacteraceae bacterium]|nr:alkane 1-monooxygenase [Immundisolibacteraceae bacterium]
MEATAPASFSAKRKLVTKVGLLPMSLLALMPVVGYLLGGGLFHWFTVFWAAIGLQILDMTIGDETSNPTPEEEARYLQNIGYRVSCWVYLPAQLFAMFFCYDLIAGTGYIVAPQPLATYEIIGLAISNAIAVGIGGTLSHELCHRESRFDRFIGVLVFGVCGMANFMIYHNFWHHKYVASKNDPGSARFGETFYQFTGRNIWGKWLASWRVEKEKLARKGSGPVAIGNAMIWFTLGEVVWVGFLLALFGWVAIPLFLMQYGAVRLLLSVGDYLEHYGLHRRLAANGELEPPRTIHAWDDGYAISSVVLGVVNRHSDHHANEGRPFQILRYSADAPRYPVGNLVMLFAGFVPSLWFKIVNPIVLKHYDNSDVIPHAMAGKLPTQYEQNAVIW